MVEITRNMAERLDAARLPDQMVADDLSDFDKSIIGKDVRITIPLKSKVRLRDVAELLRGLAQRLDGISRDPHYSERHALFDAKWVAQQTQKKIGILCGLYKQKNGNSVD